MEFVTRSKKTITTSDGYIATATIDYSGLLHITAVKTTGFWLWKKTTTITSKRQMYRNRYRRSGSSWNNVSVTSENIGLNAIQILDLIMLDINLDDATGDFDICSWPSKDQEHVPMDPALPIEDILSSAATDCNPERCTADTCCLNIEGDVVYADDHSVEAYYTSQPDLIDPMIYEDSFYDKSDIESMLDPMVEEEPPEVKVSVKSKIEDPTPDYEASPPRAPVGSFSTVAPEPDVWERGRSIVESSSSSYDSSPSYYRDNSPSCSYDSPSSSSDSSSSSSSSCD